MTIERTTESGYMLFTCLLTSLLFQTSMIFFSVEHNRRYFGEWRTMAIPIDLHLLCVHIIEVNRYRCCSVTNIFSFCVAEESQARLK